jgi:UDP-sugar transporter A1/2/3
MTLIQLACYYRDGPKLQEKGFLHGYNRFVWSVIILQAAGGMVRYYNYKRYILNDEHQYSRRLVKYADNVLKGFATSISILTACLASSYLLNDVNFNGGFYGGSIIVLVTVFLYSYTPPSLSSIF